MNALVSQTADMLALLPDEDVSLVNAFVKKLILAWDPEFTKVTLDEKKILDEADEEIKNGIYYSEEDVWN
jgi:hypothetical protein